MSSLSPAAQLALMPAADREVFLMGLTPQEMKALRWDWKFWARPQQLEPPGDWMTWMILAGRGFGKTRAGSEWIRSQVCGDTPLAPGRCRRVALVAETAADGRDVMVQGPSGILAVHPPEFRPRYVKSDRALYWPNGAMALLFSAEDPEQLRGPEHDCAWCDELAKWNYPQETWDMLQFGMRYGENPRQLVTTTPRPIPLVRELLKAEGKPNGTHVTRGSTFDNAANLARNFLAKIKERYEGTRLGRQELHAELLDDVPGALWTRTMFEYRSSQNPIGALLKPDAKLPQLVRVVVGVDPSGTSGEEEDSGDDVGIVVAALGSDNHYYVLEDATVNLGPAGWARHAVYKFEEYSADAIVAERNYGGAMVEHTLRTVKRSIPYKDVVATRGKVVRAEPIAALYEQGRCHHLRSFAQLEDELCSMTSTGYLGRGSPNRVDALVWALSELHGNQDTYDPELWARLAAKG